MRITRDHIRFLGTSAVQNIRRHHFVSAVVFGTMTLALLFWSTFIFISLFTATVATAIESSISVPLPLVASADAFAIETLEHDLGVDPEVANFEHRSADETLNDFRKKYPEIGSFVDATEIANPFSEVILVRLTDPSVARRWLLKIKNSPHAQIIAIERTERILAARNRLGEVLRVTAAIRSFTFLIGLFFLVFSFVALVSTVRLSLHARRDEVKIMQLVGAPLQMIRGPFIIEGAIFGICGAIVATILTGIGANIFSAKSASYLAGTAFSFSGGISGRIFGGEFSNFADFFVANFFGIFVLLVVVGIATGTFASFVAVRER